jgi:hypothetical protein
VEWVHGVCWVCDVRGAREAGTTPRRAGTGEGAGAGAGAGKQGGMAGWALSLKPIVPACKHLQGLVKHEQQGENGPVEK